MRGLLCVLVYVLWCATSQAEPHPNQHSEEPHDLDVDPIVIQDNQPESPERDTSASASVISPSPVHPGPIKASDLLRGIPGLQTRVSGSGIGRPATISVRGTDNQQALILLDDVPLNPSIGGGVDLSMLPLSSTGKMEVYRGGSSIFGANAIGGALRFMSHEPSTEPVVRVSAGGGSFGTGFVNTLVSNTSGVAGWVGSASLLQSAGDFPFVDSNGNERIQKNNAVRAGQATLRLSAEVSEGHTLEVINHFSASKRGSPGVEQFPSLFADQENINNVLLLRALSHQVGHPDVSQNSQLWHRFDRFRFSDPAPFVPPAISNQSVSHAVGAFSQWDAYLTNSWLLQGRLEGTVEWATVSRSGAIQQPTRNSGGIAILNEIELMGDVLRIIFSGRLDITEGFSPVPLGKIGLVVSPHNSLVFTANAGRSYRVPSFSELYYDSGNLRGNPSLQPENAWSVDVGAEFRNDWLSIRATGFFLAIQNLILFLPKTAFVIEADDSKQARNFGVEAEVSVHPWPFLRWQSTYTLTDARFVDSGLRLPARSAHQIYCKITFTHPYIEMVADAHWQSDITLDRFEQLREEARWMLGAAVHARPTPRLTASLSAHNLLNKQDAVDSLQQPLSGLSVLGSLTFTM